MTDKSRFGLVNESRQDGRSWMDQVCRVEDAGGAAGWRPPRIGRGDAFVGWGVFLFGSFADAKTGT